MKTVNGWVKKEGGIAEMLGWIKALFCRQPRFIESGYSSRMQSATIPGAARERIAEFVRTWPDQKLHDVYAFCQDGKMDFGNCCSCILGVFGSDVLHVSCDLRTFQGIPLHYLRVKAMPGMEAVEKAYLLLGFGEDGLDSRAAYELRQTRLLEILGAEMKRRNKTRPTSAIASKSLPHGGPVAAR